MVPSLSVWNPLVVCLSVALQRRLGVWAYSLIVVASVIFWFAGLGDCSRSAFQYQGLPVTEVGTLRRCTALHAAAA